MSLQENNDKHLPVNTLIQGGKYKVIRFISSGGFGCTYEAEHIMLEKRVAIKEFFVKDFCNRDETTSNITVGTTSKQGLVDKLKGKFIEEAKALCKLQNPGIVQVSDVFEENGTAYFVMDYIKGKSLSELVKQNGPMSEQKALHYIKQVALALQYVHNHNRLHLDVKPGNIMVDENDNAILIDFGASKQYDECEGENTSTLLGKTPGYAPLEQMGNDVVKFMPATDIYALGATMYKLITGVTPLSANLIATGEQLEPLPVNISEATRKTVMSSMNVNKSKRPQTIKEFLQSLDAKPSSCDNDDDQETVLNDLLTDDSKESAPEKPSVKPEQPEKSDNEKKGSPVKLFASLGAGVLVIIGVVLYFTLFSQPKDAKNLKFTNNKGVTYVYTGPINSKGEPEGVGIGYYNDKENSGIYKGNYSHGIRHGNGEFITKDSSNHFKGVYSKDMYSKGVLKFKDGSYYDGTFESNKFDTGKYYNKDGSLISEVKKGNVVDK